MMKEQESASLVNLSRGYREDYNTATTAVQHKARAYVSLPITLACRSNRYTCQIRGLYQAISGLGEYQAEIKITPLSQSYRACRILLLVSCTGRTDTGAETFWKYS